jgi:SAM-dependent methyltransferase
MENNILQELHQDLGEEATERLKFTEKAFRILPKLEKPRILDVGCGEGLPTLELVRLSNGVVIGMDIDQAALGKLSLKIKETGKSDQVRVVVGSLLQMPFSTASLDVIWAEGAIWVIGLEAGLKGWRRLIKPSGYLVLHEMTWLQPNPPDEIVKRWRGVYPGIGTAEEYIDIISDNGYEVLDYFLLPEDAWWQDYYGPLEDRILSLRKKYDLEAVQKVLDGEQREVDLYRKYSKWYGSAFFILRRGD